MYSAKPAPEAMRKRRKSTKTNVKPRTGTKRVRQQKNTSGDDEFNWETIDPSSAELNVRVYGSLASFIGKTFKDIEDVNEETNPFTFGKITAVVKCNSTQHGPHFKYYNPITFPDTPPSEENEEAWGYTAVKEMLVEGSLIYQWLLDS